MFDAAGEADGRQQQKMGLHTPSEKGGNGK
jgi:hypothetical protein